MFDSVTVDGPVAVIGDIHGQSDLLAALLEKLGPDIPIFVTGDVGDRGPDTKGVLDLLVARKALGVSGNHDLWLARWADGKGVDSAAMNAHMGGAATLTSYGAMEDRSHWHMPSEHRKWITMLAETPLLELDVRVDGQSHGFYLAHAGIPDKLLSNRYPRMNEEDAMDLLHGDYAQSSVIWGRSDPQFMAKLSKPIIFGHTSLSEPFNEPHAIGIDLGCGCGPNGWLCAVILPQRTFVFAKPSASNPKPIGR